MLRAPGSFGIALPSPPGIPNSRLIVIIPDVSPITPRDPGRPEIPRLPFPGVNSIGAPRPRLQSADKGIGFGGHAKELKSKDPEYFGMFIPANQLFHWMSLGKPGLRSVPGGEQLSLIFRNIFLFFFYFFPLFFPPAPGALQESAGIFSHLPRLPAPVIIGFNHSGDVFMD